MSPPSASIKEIWSLAGPDPTCYFPGCDVKAFHPDGGVFLEMAHICGNKPKSARHDPALSKKETNGAANLILLCPNCHTQVDSEAQRDKYSCELLRSWKEESELRVGFYEAPDEVCELVKQNQVVELNDVRSESINNYAAPIVNNYYYQTPEQEPVEPLPILSSDVRPQSPLLRVEARVSDDETDEIDLRPSGFFQDQPDSMDSKSGSKGLHLRSDDSVGRKSGHVSGVTWMVGNADQGVQTVARVSVTSRILARLLDYLVWLGFLILSVCISLPIPVGYSQNLVIALLVALFIGIYETRNKGMTIGKMVLNLEIRNRDLQDIDTKRTVSRSYNTYLQVLLLPAIFLSGEDEEKTVFENIFFAASGVLVTASMIISIVGLVFLFVHKETLWDRTSKTIVVRKQKADRVQGAMLDPKRA